MSSNAVTHTELQKELDRLREAIALLTEVISRLENAIDSDDTGKIFKLIEPLYTRWG